MDKYAFGLHAKKNKNNWFSTAGNYRTALKVSFVGRDARLIKMKPKLGYWLNKIFYNLPVVFCQHKIYGKKFNSRKEEIKTLNWAIKISIVILQLFCKIRLLIINTLYFTVNHYNSSISCFACIIILVKLISTANVELF